VGRSHLAHWLGGKVCYIVQTNPIEQQNGISKMYFGRFDRALAGMCMVGAHENLELSQIVHITQVENITL
jgi:hypothetical protein